MRTVLRWADESRCQDEIVAALVRFAESQREPPVLNPQNDATVLMASRRRSELGQAYRFALATVS